MRYALPVLATALLLGVAACANDPVRQPRPAVAAKAAATPRPAPAPQPKPQRVVTVGTSTATPSPAPAASGAAAAADDTPRARPTDLTPGTHAGEDARNALGRSLSRSRSSLKRPVTPQRAAPGSAPGLVSSGPAPRPPAADEPEIIVVPVVANATGRPAETPPAPAAAAAPAAAVPAATPESEPDTAAAPAVAAAAAAATPPAPPAPSTRPNIIFLITDDQARDDFGFLGGRALSPHIDALRAGGAHLANHYVSSSVCSPSRYTCLTGQYASRTQAPRFLDATTPEGITHVMWNQGFTPGQPTLPSVLQGAGYTTGFTGKWHLGFDGRFATVPADADPTDPADPGLIATLKHNQTVMSDYLKTLGFDYAKHIYAGNPDDSQMLKKAKLNLHHQEWLTQSALEFVEENQDEPFFLYYATTLTHSPEPVDSLETDPLMSPVGRLETPITGLQPPRDDVIRRVKEAGVPRNLWGATWLDDGVGALVNKLEELGIADNTLIVYFDDHGMEYWGKGTLYQGGLISPTLAYWPGTIPAGSTVEAMTQNTDFAPTFMALAGATPPADMQIDGHDITGLLTGGAQPVRDSVYAEIGLTRAAVTADGWKYLAFRVPPSKTRTLEERLAEQAEHIATMHRQQPWTVGNAEWDTPDPEARYSHLGMGAGGTFFERIVTRQQDLPYMPNYFDPDQLYNLNDDPTETTNLANDPAHAQKLADMKALLTEHLNGLPGTFMDLKPYDDDALSK